jgi:CRISPR/Cas system CSM-associated protein Csm2 small subunit
LNSSILKLSVSFIFGAISAYVLMSYISNSEQHDTALADNIDNPTSFAQNDAENQTETDIDDAVIKSQSIEEIPEECAVEIDELQQKLSFSKGREKEIVNQLSGQLSSALQKAEILKIRLQQYEPTVVDDDELLKNIPEPFKNLVSALPPNIKEEIFDFHKQEKDVEWAYLKEQQLSDFIRTHVNFPHVKLLQVSCKVERCEVAMSDKVNAETMLESGATQAELQEFIDTENPKYKQIFEDIRTNPELNMGPKVYFPNRFDIYMLLIDKSTLPTRPDQL